MLAWEGMGFVFLYFQLLIMTKNWISVAEIKSPASKFHNVFWIPRSVMLTFGC